MFPLLWEASGLSYPELIDRLVTLALQRHAALSKLSYDVRTNAPTAELAE
jgi:D-alanine-D-alanine ligase